MWIKCSDKMPEENQVVFWHDEKTNEYWMGDYSENRA